MTKVLMLPAGQDRDLNPYTQLLRESLAASGVYVLPASELKGALRRVAAVHVHWPQNYPDGQGTLKSILRSAGLILLCTMHRARGSRIVWTVHDLHSFHQRRPRFERLVMGAFTGLVTDLVFLNESSERALERERPKLAARARHWKMPHGIYGNAYPDKLPKSIAREKLELPADETILLFAGDIKAYKNLPALIDAFGQMSSHAHLFVAGRADPASYRQTVLECIQAAQDRGKAVTWLEKRLTDEELAIAIDAADVVALPYSVSWNSGMAILALERGRPIVTSSAPGFVELCSEVSSYWVRVAEDGSFLGAIDDLGRRASAADIAILEEFIRSREWDKITADTLGLYRYIS